MVNFYRRISNMRFEMKMPDLSTNDSEVRIVRWLIEPGQRIERGRPLLEVETDKATMEVESPVSGVLQDVRSPANDAVAVGHVIAVLELEGAAMGMFARNRAAASATPQKSSTPAIPLTLAQRVAGRRLQESKQTIPHFYLQTSVDAGAMIARRMEALPVTKLAWDAFFVLAVAKAIAKFDRFRCRLDGQRLAPAETDAIGVAVDVENELYVVPISLPSTKTLEQISGEIRREVQQIRDNEPEAKKIRPALMTITNLGMCNVESFIPVINPPEPAILGIGKVMPVAAARDAVRMAVQQRCTLTLCVDHRVCSGRYAGDFLDTIVKELESWQ
jgi:pyruvate dehydrogenase E2 component (dihydrolipoamide acetyltransferase)